MTIWVIAGEDEQYGVTDMVTAFKTKEAAMKYLTENEHSYTYDKFLCAWEIELND